MRSFPKSLRSSRKGACVAALLGVLPLAATAETRRIILSPAELRSLRPAHLVILEAGWGKPEAARIPGAIPVNTDLFENGSPRWHLRPVDELQQAIGNLGIANNSAVVVYGRQSIAAARVWWVLHFAGAKAVMVLNGGLDAWQRAGYPVETGPPPKPVPQRSTAAVRHQALAAAPDVQHRGPETTLVDVRSRAEFDGVKSGYSYLAAKGRIPGAIFAGDADDSARIYQHSDGTLRDPREIEALWKRLGVGPRQGKGLIFYCGSGWRSSLAFLYAHEFGLTNIRNYSDGWSGWSTTYEAIPGFAGITPGWKQSPSGRPTR